MAVSFGTSQKYSVEDRLHNEIYCWNTEHMAVPLKIPAQNLHGMGSQGLQNEINSRTQNKWLNHLEYLQIPCL